MPAEGGAGQKTGAVGWVSRRRNPPLLSPRKPKRWVTPSRCASRICRANPPYCSFAGATISSR
ncbi:hypothetical protein BF49_0348 [Bradyrhizobium sp.]|nr:hypothetical protein BF49_0348 [Bradyrhizobium sp.]